MEVKKKEEKVKKKFYETKIDHLTFLRVITVYICEIVFEFLFGIAFIYYLYSYDEDCLYLQLEKKYIKNLVYIYIIEFALATLCFLIGIISLCGCNSLFTKIYKSFNNLFKSIIVIISVILLILISVQFFKNKSLLNKENCGHLKTWLQVWIGYQLFLISIAVIAVITICVVSIYLFCKNNSKEEDDIQAYLSEKIENDNSDKDVVAK